MILAEDIFNKQRHGLVTGSRCSCLAPKRDAKAGMIKLAKTLAKEKYFQFYDEMSTWQLEHGKRAEDLAFVHFNERIDSNIKQGKWRKKGNYGGTTDAEGKDYGIDFKCPVTLEGWLDFLYEGVGEVYYGQCQLYMKLTGFKKWVIAAYLVETQRMESLGLTYPIPEKDRMIVCEVLYDKEWHEKFDANLPFVVKERNKYIKLLKKQFEKKK